MNEELDRLVDEYKHIADNDGEHRIADLVWLVNELIYEREHRSGGVTPRVLELITKWRGRSQWQIRENEFLVSPGFEAQQCADELEAAVRDALHSVPADTPTKE